MSRTSVHFVGLHYIITMHGTKKHKVNKPFLKHFEGYLNWQLECSPINLNSLHTRLAIIHLMWLEAQLQSNCNTYESRNVFTKTRQRILSKKTCGNLVWLCEKCITSHTHTHTPMTSTHATVCLMCMTFQDSKTISSCYPNEVRSFLYEYFTNYVYLNYAFSPSSGALVRTRTIETVRYWLALREITKFCKISQYYPVCGHAFPPMTGNLIQ